MLHFDPVSRLSLDNVRNHPWMINSGPYLILSGTQESMFDQIPLEDTDMAKHEDKENQE